MKKRIFNVKLFSMIVIMMIANIQISSMLSHSNEGISLKLLGSAIAQSESGGSNPCNCKCAGSGNNICIMFDCCTGCTGYRVWCT